MSLLLASCHAHVIQIPLYLHSKQRSEWVWFSFTLDENHMEIE